MDVPNRKLDLVRKLLAKAESTDSEAERDALNEKAAALVAEYGIDAAMLAAAEPDRDKIEVRTITLDPPYALDKAHLMWAVTVPLRVKAILMTRDGWDNGRSVKLRKMELFGYKSDLDRVELLFTSLLVQVAHGLAITHVPYDEDAVAYRKSWMEGFRIAVHRRLKAAEDRARQQAETRSDQSGPSVALVLADRSALVEKAANEAHPDVKKAAQRRLNGSGLSDGYQAGQKADLGTTRVGQRTAGAIR